MIYSLYESGIYIHEGIINGYQSDNYGPLHLIILWILTINLHNGHLYSKLGRSV